MWHGNIHRALQLLTGVSFGLDACAENDSRTKSGKMLDELRVYLDRNRATIPNYAERHLAGEPISSATAEATVNLVIANGWSRSNRCAGHPPAPTTCSKSAPESSTTNSTTTSTDGTRVHHQNQATTCPLQPDLPRNVTVSWYRRVSQVSMDM